MIASAKAGFARRSQSAGGFGNPFRVPVLSMTVFLTCRDPLRCRPVDTLRSVFAVLSA